jgi:hypothetical protein
LQKKAGSTPTGRDEPLRRFAHGRGPIAIAGAVIVRMRNRAVLGGAAFVHFAHIVYSFFFFSFFLFFFFSLFESGPGNLVAFVA